MGLARPLDFAGDVSYAETRPHSTRFRPRTRLGLAGSGDTGVAHSSCHGGGSQLLTPEGLTETESRCSPGTRTGLWSLGRKLVIGSSVQHSSGTLLLDATPLLEEER